MWETSVMKWIFFTYLLNKKFNYNLKCSQALMFGRKTLLGKFLSHAFCNIFAMHQHTFTTVQYFIYTFVPNYYFLSPSTVQSLCCCVQGTWRSGYRSWQDSGFSGSPHTRYIAVTDCLLTRRLWSRYAPIRYGHLRVKIQRCAPTPPSQHRCSSLLGFI